MADLHPLVGVSEQARVVVPQARTYARERALQALYQWSLAGHDIKTIEEQFLAEQPMERVDVDYFLLLLHGVPAHIGELDQEISPLLDRKISQLDPIEHSILRMGCYELKYQKEVPWRTVIDEGVKLAKKFGAADESYKYVNGVLDKLARKQL
ncbi:transcription antitermination factor NusB [Thioflexithrix psekupsensis]|uniref:Transcription antitermination protein NusB n=1 Tax=Thioflexithrix psekupsensis TaxID=1570016 RepID=A0A251XBB9_9GAMM|nr:transcription antitermination factor NusB [Thioflexithrix psekupsensis]OUD15215.1 hypothetical protein TPSD3_01400 [Thioflexithrix psekupsensis]